MRNVMLVIAGAAAGAALGLGGCGADPEPPPPPPPPPADCVLDAPAEKTPGFPFDPQMFRNDVWPVLAGSCLGGGCHDGPNGLGNFSVWPVSDDQCDFVNTFNQVAAKTDLINAAANSRVYVAVSGSKPGHVSLASKPDDLEILLDYVTDAYERQRRENPITVNFDFDRYQTAVDPLFEKNGCLISGCHDPGARGGGFFLDPDAAPGSDAMQANFEAVTRRVEVNSGKAGAAQSVIYVRTQKIHFNAGFTPGDAGTLLAWIEDALPDRPEPPATCADAGRFNASVFGAEIMPVLEGRVDLNDRDGGTSTGCTRSACHGAQRGAGTLFLDPAADPAENLERFACFVNLDQPSASAILACPLGLSSCPFGDDHPGGDIFSGVTDLNYQRVLSYLYAATSNSPLDFAFYARRIDPLFNDEDAVQDGATNQTCASVQGCHGVVSATQPPPNRSNFPIIAEATDEADLRLNYASASNFTHFPDPGQSALILYPTNEIANVDNPLGTGLRHPVTAFAIVDEETQLILEWAGGLRATAEGFLRHWLVAGDYQATNVTDEAIDGEDTLTPEIFDDARTGGRFNNGLWDGFFSAADFIDLNDPVQGFFVQGGQNRIVYAVAYVTNTSTRDIDAVFEVSSPNDVELTVGNGSGAIGRAGAGAVATARLPPYAANETDRYTRILIKVFQRPGDAQFGFDLRISDANGNLLQGNELLFKLSPDGSI
jgi:hypothetical protein